MIRPGGFELQLAQQLMVKITEFEPTDISRDSKETLQRWQQTTDQHSC